MTDRPYVLHSLMVSLIYPAVLGSVLFGTMQAVAETLRSGHLSGFLGGSIVEIVLKLLLLGLILLFYCCDYVYTVWSPWYGAIFFALDLTVLAALTLISVNINLSSKATPAALEISLLFALVLLLYLFWDWRELRRRRGRRHFLEEMCKWELASAVGMLLLAAATRLGLAGPKPALFLVFVLGCSTGYFVHILHGRAEELKDQSSANQEAQASAESAA